jgi:hypothetical protein
MVAGSWNLASAAIVSGAAIVMAAVLALLLSPPAFLRGPHEPADFRIKDSTLVIVNARGRELWRFDTKLPDLLDEAQYRGRFQRRQVPPGVACHMLPLLIIQDLNHDGHLEVLFVPAGKENLGSNRLYCFDGEGKVLWEVEPGRPITYGRVAFSDFVIQGIDALGPFGDSRTEVVCLAHALHEWPTQLLALGADGRRLGEYWNSGRFTDVVCADLDKDGRKELLAVGFNHEYGKGCLVVFDPGDVLGGSPQSVPEYICPGLEPGSQRDYLLFPRTDVDRLMRPVESMVDITLPAKDTVQLMAFGGAIYYDLDFKLDVRAIRLSRDFLQNYAEFWRAGKIQPELTPDYQRELEKRLKSSVLYYNRASGHWTSRMGLGVGVGTGPR